MSTQDETLSPNAVVTAVEAALPKIAASIQGLCTSYSQGRPNQPEISVMVTGTPGNFKITLATSNGSDMNNFDALPEELRTRLQNLLKTRSEKLAINLDTSLLEVKESALSSPIRPTRPTSPTSSTRAPFKSFNRN